MDGFRLFAGLPLARLGQVGNASMRRIWFVVKVSVKLLNIRPDLASS